MTKNIYTHKCYFFNIYLRSIHKSYAILILTSNFSLNCRILLILVVFGSAQAAVNITCDFAYEGDEYVAKLQNQSYNTAHRGMKIYGRHEFTRNNAHVTVLDAGFKKNKFEIVPTTLLRIFSNLAEIRFQDAGLKTLTTDSFKYCQKVKTIKFENDDMNISANTFKQCRSLEVLHFNNNDLSAIDKDAFFGLENLKILNVENCNLYSVFKLRELLKPLKRLEEINLSGNNLKQFPTEALQNLPALRKINMSFNEMTAFNSLNLKFNQHLEFLDVSNNSIQSLDRTFLENWQNNAGLDIRSNVCIDKKYDALGTEQSPMFEVVGDFMECFSDTKKVPQPPTTPNLSKDDEDESDSNEETVTTKTTAAQANNSLTNENDVKNNTHTFIDNEKANVTQTDVASDDDEKQKSTSVDDDGVVGEQMSKNVEIKEEKMMTDSPFEFAHNNGNETKIVDVKEIVEKNQGSVNFTLPISKVDVSSVVGNKKNSSESVSEENVEELANSTLIDETTTEATSTAAGKKKRRKNKKGKIEASTLPTIVEASEAVKESGNLSINETALESEIIDKSTTEIDEATSMPDKSTSESVLIESSQSEIAETTAQSLAAAIPHDYLHEYEQATCQFHIDQNQKYNCVLRNVSQELKRVNVNHLGNLTNENVSAVHFRQSNLVHVPVFLTNFFPNLDYLSFENSNLKVMDNEFIVDCKNIKTLDMKNNKIRRVERDSLKACIDLEEVDLSGNPIETIEGGVFECNPKLSIKINSLKILPSHMHIKRESEKKEENEVRN